MRKLSYYQDFTDEMIEEYRDTNDLRDDIEKLATADFELPSSITEVISGIRTVRSTDAGDAIVAARKVLANANVQIEVIPPMPANGMAGQIAGDIDTALTWHWHCMNRRGAIPPLYQMADYAVLYSTIACQVEKLSRKFKKEKGARKRAMLRGSEYALTVHDPRNVFAEVSPYLSPERVTLRRNISLADAINEYGRDVCQKLIEDKDKNITERDQDVTVYDYTDYVERCVFAGLGESAEPGACGEILFQKEHKLPFLNWVYRQAPHPLLELLSVSKANDNFNILLSLQLYNITALSGQPRIKTKTIDKQGVDVDYTKIGGTIDVGINEDATQMPPPQVDPGLEIGIAREKANINQTTQISRALTALDQLSGNAFSTINTMREVGVASLADPIHLMRQSIEDSLYLIMEWQKYDKTPLTGYVLETQDKFVATKTAGAQVGVDLRNLEPSDFRIDVTVEPDPGVNQQGRMNLAQLASNVLHFGHKKMWEIAGYMGAEQSFMDWQDEQVKLGDVVGKAEAAKMRPVEELKLEMMKRQLDMQMQAQQMQIPQQQPAQPPGQFPAAQGVDQRAGGSSAMQSNPQATREAITGRTRQGQEVV